MNASILNAVWKHLGTVDLSPTETLVFLALAAFTTNSSGSCHPRHGQLMTKTGLSRTATKSALAGLKAKGFVRWNGKPAHVNEYRIVLNGAPLTGAAAGGAGKRVDNDNSAVNDLVNRARLHLARAFLSLVPNPTDRTALLLEFRRSIVRRSFASADSLFYEIRSEMRQRRLDGPDIAKAILDRLDALPPQAPVQQPSGGHSAETSNA